jgi:hypothetical protein
MVYFLPQISNVKCKDVGGRQGGLYVQNKIENGPTTIHL